MGSHKLNSELFKENLERFIGPEKFTGFSDLLQKHKAILAGGAPLAAFHGSFINDFDIYVQLENAQAFFFDLTQLFPIRRGYGDKSSTGHLVPPYDQSFLAKNNIVGRVSNTHLNLYNRELAGARGLNIDLQVVSDHITLSDVPKNFDLTFCMIWYDGKDLFAVHPEDVRTKKGMLEPPYFRALLRGNVFTLKRMRKYIQRGYVVKYPSINTGELEMAVKKEDKVVISPERWLTEKLMSKVINCIGNRPLNNFNEHFNIIILFLDMMKKLELGEDTSRKLSPNDLFKFNNLKTILTEMYSPVAENLNRELDTHDFSIGTFRWSVNYFIYILLCSSIYLGPVCGVGLLTCYYKMPWTKYITDVSGIVIKGADPRGFNDEVVPLCEGQNPPFSPGVNGLPPEITFDNLREIIIRGQSSLSLHNDSLQGILESNYPGLRPPAPPTAAERFAQQVARDTEARDALRQRQIAEGTIIEEAEEEEAAEGEYTLPGTDREVPARCFSEVDGEDINTRTWYPTPGTILFLIEFAPGLESDLVCTSIQDLNRRLRDNVNILYQCVVPEGGNVYYPAGDDTLVPYASLGPHDSFDIVTGSGVNKTIEYIPFTYAVDERGSTRGYLPRPSVERIIRATESADNARVFVLKFEDSMSHTFNKVGSGALGANHCQSGSTVYLFKVENYGDESSVAVEGLDRQTELTEAVNRALVAHTQSLEELQETQSALQRLQDTFTEARDSGMSVERLEEIQEEWANAAALVGSTRQNLEATAVDLAVAQEELDAVQAPTDDVALSPLAPRELFPTDEEADVGVDAEEEADVDAEEEPQANMPSISRTTSVEERLPSRLEYYALQEAESNARELGEVLRKIVLALTEEILARRWEEEEAEEDLQMAAIVAAATAAREREANARLGYTDARNRVRDSTVRLLDSIKASYRAISEVHRISQSRLTDDLEIADFNELSARVEELARLTNKSADLRTILERIVEIQPSTFQSSSEDELRQELREKIQSLTTGEVELIMD